jgi:uncharacterized membrane protein
MTTPINIHSVTIASLVVTSGYIAVAGEGWGRWILISIFVFFAGAVYLYVVGESIKQKKEANNAENQNPNT